MFDYKPGRFQLKMWNAEELGILPSNWAAQVDALALTHSELCILSGTSSTTREAKDFAPIKICVVNGAIIQKELAWLYEAYAGPLRELAQELINKELVIATHLGSTVNVNVIEGQGGRYERHVDSNPVTGLLYATTLSEEDGGALVFDHKTGPDLVCPRSGLFIAFDALETPHYVAPLRRNCRRLSIPMNYYLADAEQRRPDDLDAYLYSKG